MTEKKTPAQRKNIRERRRARRRAWRTAEALNRDDLVRLALGMGAHITDKRTGSRVRLPL